MERKGLKPWWLIVAALFIVILILGGWFYLAMFDLQRIKSTNGCTCEGIFLEQEVKQAESIYSGRVTKISRNIDGSYQVTVLPAEILKGDEEANVPLQLTVDERCPYPFQKDHVYTFILSAEQADTRIIDQCSQIINEADIETMNQINRWLNRTVEDDQPTVPNPAVGEDVQSGGADIIYQALKAGVNSVRIEEEGYQTWLYDDAESLFFYSPEARISFFTSIEHSITEDDFQRFVQGISIKRAKDGRKIPFAIGEVSVDVKELPIVIKLFDAPKEDIVITFASPVEEESLEIAIRYTEPFDYELMSDTDPNIEQYMNMIRQGYQAPHYVTNGRTQSYTFHFNQPVDRGSLYEKLNESLQHHPTVAWSMHWLDDQAARLSLSLEDDATEAITFSLNGVRTEHGYRMVTREKIVIQPVEVSTFHAIDLATRTKEAYFQSVIPYEQLDVSPQGSYLLMGRVGYNGMHNVYQYTIRDRFGEVLQTYGMDEMKDPVWLDEGRLAYVTERELQIVDVKLDQTDTVWQIPNNREDERIVSFHYSPLDGKLAIGARYITEVGDYIYDLYVFDDLQDTEPIILEGFGSYECLEGQCEAPEVQFSPDNSIIYSRWEELPSDPARYTTAFYKMNLEDQTVSRIEPWGGGAAPEHWMFAMPDGKMLYISITKAAADEEEEYTDSGIVSSERWAVYDPVTDTSQLLFDTNIGLFDTHWPQQVYPFQVGQVLLHLYERGWYMLNIDNRQLMPYSDLSHRTDVIDIEMERIWFFE